MFLVKSGFAKMPLRLMARALFCLAAFSLLSPSGITQTIDALIITYDSLDYYYHTGMLNNDKREGLWKIHFLQRGTQTPILNSSQNFKRGKPVGECLAYYPNGQIKSHNSIRRNGNPKPITFFYSGNGSLQQKRWTSADEKKEKFINYHPNGAKAEKGQLTFIMRKGHDAGLIGVQKTGTWMKWDENGHLLEKKRYSGDEPMTVPN